jgi:hypothetical protein
MQEHSAALESLRHEIAETERRMVGKQPDDVIVGQHQKAAAAHEKERAVHERLKQSHHLLLAALATLKHGPNRQG